MNTIDHLERLDKFPKSVYGLTGNLQKLWTVIGTELNRMESSFFDSYNVEENEGIQLDKIGMLSNVPRGSLSDSEYRTVIYNPSPAKFITLPSIHEIVGRYSSNYTLYELCYPIDYEFSVLDGNSVLDGSGYFKPEKIPTTTLFWDGKSYLDGTQPLKPNMVRSASILIRLEVDATMNYGLFEELIRSLALGISFYFEYTVKINESISPASFRFYKDGSMVLSKTGDTIELYEIEIQTADELRIYKIDRYLDGLGFLDGTSTFDPRTLYKTYKLTRFELNSFNKYTFKIGE